VRSEVRLHSRGQQINGRLMKGKLPMIRLTYICRGGSIGLAVMACTALGPVPAMAQPIEAVDPEMSIDAELSQSIASDRAAAITSNTGELPPLRHDEASDRYYTNGSFELERGTHSDPKASGQDIAAQPAAEADTLQTEPGTTYQGEELTNAAEAVFGPGAEGLARLIEDIIHEQGEPNGYIVGHEGGGAFIFGIRYGSGTLFHKVEGNMPVYWTGPSIGLDAGVNAGDTFVLVYNLHDTEELYDRFAAGEGQAYVVAGFNASYMRKGQTVLIPIRVGVGLRLGVNAGYMRFSKKPRALPF